MFLYILDFHVKCEYRPAALLLSSLSGAHAYVESNGLHVIRAIASDDESVLPKKRDAFFEAMKPIVDRWMLQNRAFTKYECELNVFRAAAYAKYKKQSEYSFTLVNKDTDA